MRSCDIAVVGAGPAGLFAAGRIFQAAAERGLPAPQVVILEGNPHAGNKLLLTGGGRCNLTNNIEDPRQLSERYGKDGKAFIGPFGRFGATHTRQLFSRLGLDSKVEAEGRVFPRDDRAESVLSVLQAYAAQAGLLTGSRVSDVRTTAEGFELSGVFGQLVCRRLILAGGGFARPETGSDASTLKFAARLGHHINKPDAMLVPIELREKQRVAALMGNSIQDCGIRILLELHDDGEGEHRRVLERRRGKLLFTHFGLSGPAILNLSGRIGELETEYGVELSRGGRIVVELNPHPEVSIEKAERLIGDSCSADPKKLAKNALAQLIAPRYYLLYHGRQRAILEKRSADLTRDDRRSLAKMMCALEFTYRRRLPSEDAIVARGGVPLREVDFRRFESKLCPGMFIVGDMLDINRPSGGYSLQICWTSSWIAGESALESL